MLARIDGLIIGPRFAALHESGIGPKATSNVVGLRAVLLCVRVLSFRQLRSVPSARSGGGHLPFFLEAAILAGLIHLTRCMAVALAPETLVNCVAPGLLDGTRATANLRSEQIERSASSSLLKRPADKDDCADMVVAMCRTETMTGQTVVIDSGRIFH